MASSNPRVQVTVDPELRDALASVDPKPASKSRLIRNLALRGAEASREDAEEQSRGQATLLAIARGEVACDFDVAREIHAERERSVEPGG